MPAFVMTAIGWVSSSSFTWIILSVPSRSSLAIDSFEMIAAPRFSSTIRFTSSLLDSSITIGGSILYIWNT
ncbi:MAG: hypothetical protein K0Q94_4259 [Paenibacillus sp.]|nr:hypothetical protein [Paenibacillus sp.]